MQLLVAVKLDDNRCCAQPITANRDDRPVLPPPAINRPRTTFVAQLITSWLGLAQTRARKQRELIEVSGSYTAASRLSLPERPVLDRSV
jgi:hypothetical protein